MRLKIFYTAIVVIGVDYDNLILKAGKKMIKKLIAITVIITMLSVVLTGCGNVSSRSGSWVGMSEQSKADGWTISAKTVNGHSTRTVDLTSDNLSVFHIKSENSDGTVALVITQGDTEKTIELSREYEDAIDLSDFMAGKVKLRLSFEKAKDIKVSISW